MTRVAKSSSGALCRKVRNADEIGIGGNIHIGLIQVLLVASKSELAQKTLSKERGVMKKFVNAAALVVILLDSHRFLVPTIRLMFVG